MSTSIKRLMQEFKELKDQPSSEFTALPTEEDIHHWHFTIRGPKDSVYERGRYHGRLLFSTDYPYKPPNIIFLTPNGRFQVGQKICLSITGYHPESWRPAWGIRTALTAIISFMTMPGEGSLGAIEWGDEARREAARTSLSWKCDSCGSSNATALPSEDEVASVALVADPELCFNVKDSKEGLDQIEGPSEATSGETNSVVAANQNEIVNTESVDGVREIPVAETEANPTRLEVSEFTQILEADASPPQIREQTRPWEMSPIAQLWGIDILIILCVGFLLKSLF